MVNYIVFISIIISLLVYAYAARNARNEAKGTADDYYLAKGTTKPSEFAVTQTAYQLQMATVYPFFLFAFTGNWWIGFVNNVGYFLGIGIYFLLLPFFSKGSANIVGKSSTIHDAIARLHSLPYLRKLTGWMTIIAFAGLAAFEITWGSRVFRVLFDGGDSVYYLAISTLAAYLVLYVWAGGQRANIGAAQYQLFFAYAGLHSLVAWLALQDKVSFSGGEFAVIVPVIILLSAIMLFMRLRICLQPQLRFLRYLNILTVVSLGGMLIGLTPKLGTLSLPTDLISTITKAPSFWLTSLSVGLLPLFFQFVDTSNWQRLTSLIVTPGNRMSEARKGLKQYLIESPLSWLLPIFSGLCAAQFLSVSPNADPWDALLGFILHANSYWYPALAILVFVGIVAIFMSTADELLTTIAYVYAYDLSKVSRRLAIQSSNSNAESAASVVYASGRTAMTVATAIVIGLFIVVDVFFTGNGQKLIGAFLAFYGPLISLAPSLVVPAITGRVAHQWFATLSLALGAAAGLLCGFWSLLVPDAFGGDVTWFGSLASFGVSWALYLVGLIGGRQVHIEAQHVN